MDSRCIDGGWKCGHTRGEQRSTETRVMSTEPVAWRPTPETIADANLTHFIRAAGRRDCDDLLLWSVAEPEAFTRTLLTHIDYRFTTPFTQAIDDSRGQAWTRW